MSRIAFFHGLESPAISDKSEYLLSTFPNSYAPAIDYSKAGIFDEVLKEVKKRKIDLLVGSSMGGWFAYCISTITGIPTILFNPAVHSRYMEPEVKRGSTPAKHTVVMGKKDEIISPEKTQKWFKSEGVGSFNYKMESNGHRTPLGIFRKYLSVHESTSLLHHVKLFEEWLNESIKDGVIACNNCEWKWDIVTGGDDPYTCHKCGHDNEPVNEKESPYDKETLQKYKKEYEDGKDIPFGVKTSLIAQGLIPREGGPDKGKAVKSPEYD